MNEDDLYEVLNVSPRAEPEVIAAAFKALALKYHPDRHADRRLAERRMSGLNRAWAVLGDPAARQAYDLQRSAPKAAPPTSRAVPPSPSYGGRWPRARLQDHEAVVLAIDERSARLRCSALNPKLPASLSLSLGVGEAPLSLPVRILAQTPDSCEVRFGPLEGERLARLRWFIRQGG